MSARCAPAGPPPFPPAGSVDWERLSRTPLLRLHAALILGICDPVPMPSPMTAEEGAWVWRNALTPELQAIDAVYPWGIFRWCDCQRGRCWNCLNDRCDICVHRQHGGVAQVAEDLGTITDARGFVVARIVHRQDQRPCRWMCRCECPKTGPAPPTPTERRRAETQAPCVRAAQPAPLVAFRQLELSLT